MTEIEINKEEFITHFLNPIKKVNVDGNCSIYSEDGKLISVSSTPDKVCIIYSSYTPKNISEDFSTIHISDIKRLILALKCIETDDIILNIDGDKLFHDSKKFKFSTYLLDDKYITKVGANPKKIDALTFDTEFSVNKEAIRNIKIAQMIAPDASKLYFYTEQDKVYVNLNDKSKVKIDNASLEISETFTGEPIENKFIINGEFLKLITQFKDDIVFKINQKQGVMVLEVEGEQCKIKYITSALVK